MGREPRKEQLNELLEKFLPAMRQGDVDAAKRFLREAFPVLIKAARKYCYRAYGDESRAAEAIELTVKRLFSRIVKNPNEPITPSFVWNGVNLAARDVYRADLRQRNRAGSLDYRRDEDKQSLAASVPDTSNLGKTPPELMEIKETNELHETYKLYLPRLTSQERSVIELRYGGEKKVSRKDVAAQLTLTPDKVLELEDKAKKKLRELLALDHVCANGTISEFDKAVFEKRAFQGITFDALAEESGKESAEVMQAYWRANAKIKWIWNDLRG